MLKNAALDAKIGFDPAENEPPKEWLCRGRVTAGRGGRRVDVEAQENLVPVQRFEELRNLPRVHLEADVLEDRGELFRVHEARTVLGSSRNSNIQTSKFTSRGD